MFDAGKSGYEVGGIRTIGCDERQCTCKASIKVSLELLEVFRQLSAEPEADGYLRMTQPKYAQKEATFDVLYTAELTDDGKDVYITMDGM